MIDRDGDSSQTLRFQVKPESLPPTNIHAIIGRNGVGKSHLLHSMTKLIVREDDPECHGAFKYAKGTVADDYFVNVVSIASAHLIALLLLSLQDSWRSRGLIQLRWTKTRA